MVDIFYKIKNESDSDMIMYRVNFDYEFYSTKLLYEVDEFMRDNYPDHYCVEYGKHYWVQDGEHIEMALKLRF